MSKITPYEQAQAKIEEYQQKRAELEIRYKKELRDILVPYAAEHAKYKVGDIIREFDTIIRIDKIGAKVTENDIVPVYSGTLLTKTLKEKKGTTPIQMTESNKMIKLK